jgi:hypothetical protein
MGFLTKLFGRQRTAPAVTRETPSNKYWPRIGARREVSRHMIGPYTAVLLADIESLQRVQYEYVLIVQDEAGETQVCISSEPEDAEYRRLNDLGPASFVLGLFPGEGHENYGRSDDWGHVDKFRARALELAAKFLGIEQGR